MVTIERVICPIDLSEHSARALRHGAAWAKYYDARLHVLHVAPLPQPLLSPAGVFAALPMRPLEDIKAEVHHFVADTLGDDHDAIANAIVDVVQGQTAGAIVDASSQAHALLVMGTHGWSGLDRLLLGSVAERVAHLTHCPLLVVPPDAQSPPSGAAVRQVLCAVDLRPSSLAGMRYGLSLAQEVKARIELLTVIEGPGEGVVRELLRALPPENDRGRHAALEELRERVPEDARAWCEVQENVIMGRPAEVLLRRAEELEADLIVMGTGDRPHLHGAWLGSTTGRILRQAHCPVLIVPAPERLALRTSSRSSPRRRRTHWRAVMIRQDNETNRLQPPLVGLERTLIHEFLRARGLDPESLETLPEAERHALMTEASTYASMRLTEIESRSHFVEELHGAQDSGGHPIK
jgi:nucleotide-binding universal stress UspA family protein